MKEIIHSIASQLQAVYSADEAEALAWWIAEEKTGLSRTQLLFGCKDTTFLRDTQTMIDRLLHFEPIQYIFGHTLWCGLDLLVTPATLIPRPETAELVERIEHSYPYGTIISESSIQHSECRVLDIGTGSGCIAIALKKKHPEWKVTGIDISEEAIAVAKQNAERNGVEVEFRVADILSDEIKEIGRFDIVVSNPPYICEKEKAQMRPNVLDYEPETALFVPDNDPLLFYRRIAYVRLGTYLFFEINEAYGEPMKAMMAAEGYQDILITNDMYGKARIIEGRMA